MHFSKEEIRDLIKAWVAISLAVSIAIVGINEIRAVGFSLLIRAFVIYGLTVGVAFLSHEILGHKLLAQRRGLFAEFRADDLFLMLAVLLSVTGFVFVAPGAVVISGVTRIATYGKIAAAGPIVNIFLSFVFLILVMSGFEVYLPLYAGERVGLIFTGALINAWLALFNLFPLGVLDGAKVLAWNKGVWVILIGISGLLLFSIFNL